MSFTSAPFLFYFLPLTVVIYFCLPNLTLRNVWLLTSGAIYYFLFEPGQNFILLCLLIPFNYLIADFGQKVKRRFLLLWIGIFVDCAALIFFKLSGSHLIFPNHPYALPLGISFYTFQMISFLVDTYWSRNKKEKSLFSFATFIFFFPHIQSGPIVRYYDVKDDLLPSARLLDWQNINLGLMRITRGLGKKLLIADVLAEPVEMLFQLPSLHMSLTQAWLGPFLFALQIFFDFSGYSDVAIGLAKVFGVHFPENFRQPFQSSSILDFWHRWHISLSTWLKDYVYLPIAFSLRNLGRTGVGIAILVTFSISGAWHGVGWGFMIWGLYHALFIIAEVLVASKVKIAPPKWLRRGYVWIVVVIGFIPFRQADISQVLPHLKSMFLLSGNSIHLSTGVSAASVAMATVGFLIAIWPDDWIPTVPALINVILHFILLSFCLSQVVGETHRAFLYFQF